MLHELIPLLVQISIWHDLAELSQFSRDCVNELAARILTRANWLARFLASEVAARVRCMLMALGRAKAAMIMISTTTTTNSTMLKPSALLLR